MEWGWYEGWLRNREKICVNGWDCFYESKKRNLGIILSVLFWSKLSNGDWRWCVEDKIKYIGKKCFSIYGKEGNRVYDWISKKYWYR